MNLRKLFNQTFPLKFKVRVVQFVPCKYIVEWCHYRFIPIWHPIRFWFDQGHPGDTECWALDMWDFKTAEYIARGFKSIKDIEKYYEADEKKELEWREKERQYLEENMPYNSKNIF